MPVVTTTATQTRTTTTRSALPARLTWSLPRKVTSDRLAAVGIRHAREVSPDALCPGMLVATATETRAGLDVQTLHISRVTDTTVVSPHGHELPRQGSAAQWFVLTPTH